MARDFVREEYVARLDRLGFKDGQATDFNIGFDIGTVANGIRDCNLAGGMNGQISFLALTSNQQLVNQPVPEAGFFNGSGSGSADHRWLQASASASVSGTNNSPPIAESRGVGISDVVWGDSPRTGPLAGSAGTLFDFLVSSAISASAAEPSGLAGPGRSARVERQRVDLVLLGVAINTVRGGVSGNGDTIGSTTTPGGVSGTGVSTPYPVGFVHGVGGVEMHVGLMTAALLASFGSVSLSFYVQPVGITADGVVLPVPEPRTCALLLVGVAVLLASYLFGPRWPWARLLRRVFASRSSSVCCGGPRRSWAR